MKIDEIYNEWLSLLLLFGKVSGEGDLKDFVDMKASQVSVEMVKEMVQDQNMPLTQNFIHQLHKVLLREDYTVSSPEGATGRRQMAYPRHQLKDKVIQIRLSALEHSGHSSIFMSHVTILPSAKKVCFGFDKARDKKRTPANLSIAADFHMRTMSSESSTHWRADLAHCSMEFFL